MYVQTLICFASLHYPYPITPPQHLAVVRIANMVDLRAYLSESDLQGERAKKGAHLALTYTSCIGDEHGKTEGFYRDVTRPRCNSRLTLKVRIV